MLDIAELNEEIIQQYAKATMDKSYKKLIKKEKALESDTKKVLSKDKARDKKFDKEKKEVKKMKGKGC
jgi:hypothetical protein